VSFLRKQESGKKLDSHFRGRDIQGGPNPSAASPPAGEASLAEAMPEAGPGERGGCGTGAKAGVQNVGGFHVAQAPLAVQLHRNMPKQPGFLLAQE